MTRINLIRAPAAQYEHRPSQWRPFRLFAILAAVVALHLVESMWVGSVTGACDSLRRNVEDLERTAAQLRLSSPPADDADQVRSSSRAAVRLRSIAASMPPDLWLVAYREHQGEATMRGMSLNDEATRAFVDNLSATPVFARLEITAAAQTEVKGLANETPVRRYEFQLKAILPEARPASTPGSPSVG